MIVIGGLDQRDGEIRGEDTSWNLGEAAARGRDGKGREGKGRDGGVLAAFLSWRAGLGPLLCPSGLHYAYDFSLVKQKPLQ